MNEERLDTETMSVPSSNKRIKEITVDRLSALPDSVLIRILSFLKMEEAVGTAVLSKRLQYLWTYLPRLEFRGWSNKIEKIRKFVTRIHRALVFRGGKYLEKFEVDFNYNECFASDVDVWVEFAVKNAVKEVTLLLNSYKNHYVLPQMMYSNSSLELLRVRGCIMDPPRTIKWSSLTTLYLEGLVLSQQVIENILSGCPVLERLSLLKCWGFNRLEVNSQGFVKLVMFDCKDGSKTLPEISAPYMQALMILLYPKRRKLRLRNIPSLLTAYINFTGCDWVASSAAVMSNTKELLKNIQHVEELELGRKCVEVLSMLALSGWQLPQSRRKCLTVNASSDEHSISGIVGLLESSPNLEELFIHGSDPYNDHPYKESVPLDPAAKGDLDRDLMHLKTVNITGFADQNLTGEPMLTLARILLKRATVLEKMVIHTKFSSTSSTNFIKIAQTLLTYPRSSQKAVVVLL